MIESTLLTEAIKLKTVLWQKWFDADKTDRHLFRLATQADKRYERRLERYVRVFNDNRILNTEFFHHPVWRIPQSDVGNFQIPPRGRPKKQDLP